MAINRIIISFILLFFLVTGLCLAIGIPDFIPVQEKQKNPDITQNPLVPPPVIMHQPVISAHGVNMTNPSGKKGSDLPYGYMPFSDTEITEFIRSEEAIPLKPSASISGISAGSVDLIGNISTVGEMRNQYNCGNCWVWTSSAVVEAALSKDTGYHTPLSIQYLNSAMNQGGTIASLYGGDSFACRGGGAQKFVDFYKGAEGKFQFVPTDHTNANFQDDNGGKAGGYNGGKQTNIPLSSIQIDPPVKINDITTQMLNTNTVGEAVAINNIKTELDAHKALYLSFTLPNGTVWGDFQNWFKNHKYDELYDLSKWNLSPYEGNNGGGGHAVLVIGYNDLDPDPTNHYWYILNSWGINPNRTLGTFRIPMHMKYDASLLNGGTPFYMCKFFTIAPSFEKSEDPVVTSIYPSTLSANFSYSLILTGKHFTSDKMRYLSAPYRVQGSSYNTISCGVYYAFSDTRAVWMPEYYYQQNSSSWSVGGAYHKKPVSSIGCDMDLSVTGGSVPLTITENEFFNPPTISGISPNRVDAGKKTVQFILSTSLGGKTESNEGWSGTLVLRADGKDWVSGPILEGGSSLFSYWYADLDLRTLPAGVYTAIVKNNGFESNPDVKVTIAKVFPKISSLSPDHGKPGERVQVVINGLNISDTAKFLIRNNDDEIFAEGMSYISENELVGTLDLTHATPGAWNAIIQQDDVESNGFPLFTVTGGSFSVSGITPTSGKLKATVPFTIRGTNFTSGAAVRLEKPGAPGITAEGVTVVSDTSITGTFVIPADATKGAYTVIVTQGGESISCPVPFTVIENTARVLKITPAKGEQNSSVSFTLKGQNFRSGAVVRLKRSGSPSITAKNVVVRSSATITGKFFIPKSAPKGNWNVAVIQGGKTSTGKVVFAITSATTWVKMWSGTSMVKSQNLGYGWYFKPLSTDLKVRMVMKGQSYDKTGSALGLFLNEYPSSSHTTWETVAISKPTTKNAADLIYTWKKSPKEYGVFAYANPYYTQAPFTLTLYKPGVQSPVVSAGLVSQKQETPIITF